MSAASAVGGWWRGVRINLPALLCVQLSLSMSGTTPPSHPTDRDRDPSAYPPLAGSVDSSVSPPPLPPPSAPRTGQHPADPPRSGHAVFRVWRGQGGRESRSRTGGTTRGRQHVLTAGGRGSRGPRAPPTPRRGGVRHVVARLTREPGDEEGIRGCCGCVSMGKGGLGSGRVVGGWWRDGSVREAGSR